MTSPAESPVTSLEGERLKAMAAALGRVPSGLFVLTVRHGDAETGMLASWVQQCSFDPPLVTVAVRRERELLAWLTDGAAFTLNVLDESQTDMVAHFGKGFRLDQEAFTGLELLPGGGAAPVLAEALAYLECRIEARHRTGDHELFSARVVGGRVLSDGRPMVHVRKSGLHY
jgi:flavin reductase (DIM6/NTAB) family NADH-FMN oxidoreductase RutF